MVKLPSEDMPTRDEYRALLRRDLVSFAQLCFTELNPPPAVPNAKVKRMAAQ